jgi:hypothetical protein
MILRELCEILGHAEAAALAGRAAAAILEDIEAGERAVASAEGDLACELLSAECR